MLQDWKEHWKARSRRVRRKIELLRLKRIRQKKTPKYSYCKNCGTPLEGMYCYRCGQYALDAEQPFWKYVASISKTSISSTPRYGIPYGTSSPDPVS